MLRTKDVRLLSALLYAQPVGPKPGTTGYVERLFAVDCVANVVGTEVEGNVSTRRVLTRGCCALTTTSFLESAWGDRDGEGRGRLGSG